jgi:hypothetical protein
MSTKPFDVTLKDLIEEAAAAWPELLGPWPFRRVEILDADLSTVVAAADKMRRVYGEGHDWLLRLGLERAPRRSANMIMGINVSCSDPL